MQLFLLSIVLCVALYATDATKLISSASRPLNRREASLVRRLAKRQAYNDPNCDRRQCAIPNCGKDSISTTLPGECCERCVPWEYAQSLGLTNSRGPQASYDPRPPQYPPQQPYNQYPYNQPAPPQQQQPDRVDVYIFGPDDGARVSGGQSIYFDCEVNSPYNQQATPRWSRAGNQPLPPKAQSTPLAGNRKLVRLTIPDATQSDAGRYECSAGTGNSNDLASIDLQVTDGGYYPRPQAPPAPAAPQYDPYDQYRQQPQYPQQPPQYDPYNQQPQYPQQPPQYDPYNQYPQQPQVTPAPQPDARDDGNDDDQGDDEDADESPAGPAATPRANTVAPPAAAEDAGEANEDGGEYPEDYTENEK